METKTLAEGNGAALAVIGLSPVPSPASALAPKASNYLSAAARGWFEEGLECLGRGEAGEAVKWFEKTLAANPDFADSHVGLGIAYACEHRIYPALDHLERATELEPDNFHAHLKLGQLYFKLRVPQKGYEEMSRALRCVVSLAERKLVAQLLREERQRERNDVRRPWWFKPFSLRTLFLGFLAVVTLFVMLSRLLH